jgi:hypothetical protein
MSQPKKSNDPLHSGKDALLQKVRDALKEAGLDEYELDSIKLYVKHGPPVRSCPNGNAPVWEPVRKPDGTVVYEWVCK